MHSSILEQSVNRLVSRHCMHTPARRYPRNKSENFEQEIEFPDLDKVSSYNVQYVLLLNCEDGTEIRALLLNRASKISVISAFF